MDDRANTTYRQPANYPKNSRSTVIAFITGITMGVAICVFLWYAFINTSTTNTVLPSVPHSIYPVGTADRSEPSGKAPPSGNALKGYSLSYENDFSGTSLPAGWDVFTGIPGGDPGGQFGSAHVVVGGGLLRLNTWKDPAYQNRWVTGGVCQCGLARTYGAYFVRSRLTGPGPNEVELLWPAKNVWPPEIDFNETGGSDMSTSSTLHFGTTNLIDQRVLSINMTKWHTWGVIWTPTAITYVVNGQIWGSIGVKSEITKMPMTLDLEQRAMCQIQRQCPTAPVSMLVDWLVEYSPK